MAMTPSWLAATAPVVVTATWPEPLSASTPTAAPPPSALTAPVFTVMAPLPPVLLT